MKDNVFETLLALLLGLFSFVIIEIVMIVYMAIPLSIAYLLYKLALSL